MSEHDIKVKKAKMSLDLHNMSTEKDGNSNFDVYLATLRKLYFNDLFFKVDPLPIIWKDFSPILTHHHPYYLKFVDGYRWTALIIKISQ